MSFLAWECRQQPLAAAGVVTTGEATPRLLARLRLSDSGSLARLTFVATRDLLVLAGATDALPWADGARYCAPDPEAQFLWLPTTMVPALPVDLLQRQACARVGDMPILLWHEPEQFLPLDGLRTLTPALLDWLESECQ